jgi:hypothetical protein
MIRTAGVLGLGAAVLLWTAPAMADNVMKVCGAKYQAAKKANSLGGQTWNQYLAQCRGSQKATPVSAPVASPAASTHALPPAAAPVVASKPASHLPGAQSPAMVAMHDRQRQCGAQWKADKAAGKIQPGQKWPQYWSACNKRLKG